MITVSSVCWTFQTGSPKIQKFAFPDLVLSGSKTSATCTAIAGAPPMEFKWYKNGHLMKMNQKSVIRTYTDFSVIFLEDVDHNISANYTCEVSNSAGSDSYTTSLEVKEPPKWIKQPKDTSLNSEANTSLECTASGHPLPNVTWKKTSSGSQDHYGIVQNQKHLSGKSILEIKQASTIDAGFYICEADNGIATIKSNGIIISVSGKT
ncbi:hemicentin-1 [Nephila pilipes]|uniref:Hemicentin-1 n=1 Tax=Nephila pilipes TaxID=299642 RepID=A0A8X6TAR7_NEPPI|nr:hemicentin-1 [Nephila pilipes]